VEGEIEERARTRREENEGRGGETLTEREDTIGVGRIERRGEGREGG
jgi:hypothetical protein